MNKTINKIKSFAFKTKTRAFFSVAFFIFFSIFGYYLLYPQERYKGDCRISNAVSSAMETVQDTVSSVSHKITGKKTAIKKMPVANVEELTYPQWVWDSLTFKNALKASGIGVALGLGSWGVWHGLKSFQII